MNITTATQQRRERPKIVRLTEAAATRISEIMADSEGRYEGVRVGVTNGGCAGMSYTMDYAEVAEPLHHVVLDESVGVVPDACRLLRYVLVVSARPLPALRARHLILAVLLAQPHAVRPVDQATLVGEAPADGGHRRDPLAVHLVLEMCH